ncbi:Hemolysins related proteins containing CBS domains [Klebsiella pneumoniae]|uniref:Hemolysins related proteins containing CBS domains n=1 Tax=Klebsiella pneumoniae TaxID=573 RepID=A0A378AD75_KLEPN|nr:Hemolysins related proteins containing CBS domains [Klebsiella pneumoniae]
MNTAIFRAGHVEDILEEIVGDFTTSMSPTLAEEVTPLNDGTVIIDGSANVREINKAFNWHLPEDEARTVNGIILEALEEIPVPAPACALSSTI